MEEFRIRNKMDPGKLSQLQKGEGFLACMRENFKDQFVTANELRGPCPRAGGYAREVLENAAKLRLVETKERLISETVYRIDPMDGVISCHYEPGKPYDQTICVKLESIIEENARLRWKSQSLLQ